jgi:hypothetical protein
MTDNSLDTAYICYGLCTVNHVSLRTNTHQSITSREKIRLRRRKFQFSKCNIKYNIHMVWRVSALPQILEKNLKRRNQRFP